MNTSFKIINAIIFQIGWFVCILTDNLISLVFTAIFILFNLLGIHALTRTLSLKNEIAWLCLGLAVGFGCETIFFNSGILQHISINTSVLFDWLVLPPIWLLCLWVMFAITMRTSLTFIVHKPLLASILAVVIAPLNYYAGASLHPQVNLGLPLLSNLVWLGVIWALALRCLTAIYPIYFKET